MLIQLSYENPSVFLYGLLLNEESRRETKFAKLRPDGLDFFVFIFCLGGESMLRAGFSI